MKVVYILFFSLLSLLLRTDIENKIEIKIKEGSRLYIKGSSNVNAFTCNYVKPMKPKKFIVFYDEIENGWQLEDAKLYLESNSFDCGGKNINRDFEELINVEQFPFIQIEVLEVNPFDSNFIAVLAISIAGKTQFLPVKISSEDGRITTYTSVLKLNIEDFDLDTPTKMMGLIKVHEEISIHVDLRLQLTSKS
jgi:hypothetical protein